MNKREVFGECARSDIKFNQINAFPHQVDYVRINLVVKDAEGGLRDEHFATTPLEFYMRDHTVHKLPIFPKLTSTDPLAAWFVVTGDATPDEIRVLGAVSSVPIVDFGE